MRAHSIRSRWLVCAGAIALTLAGCGGEQVELTQWMAQQKREVKPNVQPISPPKKFDPQPYVGVDGVEPFPSGANFILFRTADGQATWEGLLEAGVLVRNFARWPRLDNCLRVTIGLPEENDAFLAALKEVLAA